MYKVVKNLSSFSFDFGYKTTGLTVTISHNTPTGLKKRKFSNDSGPVAKMAAKPIYCHKSLEFLIRTDNPSTL